MPKPSPVPQRKPKVIARGKKPMKARAKPPVTGGRVNVNDGLSARRSAGGQNVKAYAKRDTPGPTLRQAAMRGYTKKK